MCKDMSLSIPASEIRRHVERQAEMWWILAEDDSMPGGWSATFNRLVTTADLVGCFLPDLGDDLRTLANLAQARQISSRPVPTGALVDADRG